MNNSNEIVWRIAEENLSTVKFYIDDCDRPGFFVIPVMGINPIPCFDLYLNSVGRIGTFRTLRKLYEVLREIIENANVPIVVFKKMTPTGKKEFFAKNEIWRIPAAAQEGSYIKVFNIKVFEW
jgi:hypothetical protein